jgi:hypothetical protein
LPPTGVGEGVEKGFKYLGGGGPLGDIGIELSGGDEASRIDSMGR